MKVTHVEKRPFPNENFATTHWEVELTPKDLGLPDPTNQAEMLEMALKLGALAKYITLAFMVRDGIMTPSEMDNLLQSHYADLKK